MSLPQYQLFLGLQVDRDLDSELSELDEQVLDVFIQEGDSYLRRVGHKGNSYLGKFIGQRSDLQSLHDLETNIYSLVARLAPKYPYEEKPLRLFPAKIE